MRHYWKFCGYKSQHKGAKEPRVKQSESKPRVQATNYLGNFTPLPLGDEKAFLPTQIPVVSKMQAGAGEGQACCSLAAAF